MKPPEWDDVPVYINAVTKQNQRLIDAMTVSGGDMSHALRFEADQQVYFVKIHHREYGPMFSCELRALAAHRQ